MKKTLSITAFIAAGSACAMADVYSMTNLLYGNAYSNADYNYENPISVWAGGFSSKGEFAGITNKGIGSTGQIDLGRDARYEVYFRLTWNAGDDHDQPIFNIYLGGSRSLVYGNWYWGYESGVGRMYSYNTNVANGSTSSSPATYVLNNAYADYNLYPGINWQYPMGHYNQVGLTGKPTTATHNYQIVFETFSDTNTADKCYIGVDGSWQEVSLASLGIGTDQVFSNVGYFLKNDGSSNITVNNNYSGIYKYDRTSVIPEPSAFGLLAGLGALCLVGARRRRR